MTHFKFTSRYKARREPALSLTKGLLLLLLATLALYRCDLFDIFPPEIEIVSPKEGTSYFATLPCEVKATDNRTVAKVEVFLDGKSVHEFTKEPYVADLDISGDTAHTKTLKVVAHDKAGNWAEAEREISISAPPFTTQIQKLLAPDAQAYGNFGSFVALSGEYAIVGAYGEDAGGSDAGAAYVFMRTGINSWDGGTKLTAPDAQAGDYFGRSVAISGDYALVGAPHEDAGGFNAGAAYIFQRTGINSWDSGTKIVVPPGPSWYYFGSSVAISGDYAIVGAPVNVSQGDYTGAAYVFHRIGLNNWDDGTELLPSDDTFEFGWSVAISVDYAIVGSYVSGPQGPGADVVYVFHRTGDNSWNDVSRLLSPDGVESVRFGSSVSINGNYAIVGDLNISPAGAAYIFHRIGTNSWDTGKRITAPTDHLGVSFGQRVAISGDYALVADPSEYSQGSVAGAAYIFQRTGANSWDSGTKIMASDAAAEDCFGWSVALSGDYALVGAFGEDSGGSAAGAAYVFIK